jgi:hypothetical protein
MKKPNRLFLSALYFVVGEYVGIRIYSHFIVNPENSNVRIESERRECLFDLVQLETLRRGDIQDAIGQLEHDLNMRATHIRELLPEADSSSRESAAGTLEWAVKYQKRYPLTNSVYEQETFRHWNREAPAIPRQPSDHN